MREVDEELRRDRLTGFWRKYGLVTIIGILLLLAAAAAIIWWRDSRQAEREAQAETLTRLFETIDAGNAEQAADDLARLGESELPGYRAAALLTRAALAIEDGEEAEAIGLYGEIAADESLARPYRDLARVRRTALEYDRLEPAAVIRRLEGLAEPDSPWFASAGEMAAMAYLKMGRREEAARLFTAIAKSEEVSPTMRSRATQMAGSLGVDALATDDDQADAPEEAGPTAESEDLTE